MWTGTLSYVCSNMRSSVNINMVTAHVILGHNSAIFYEKTSGSDYTGCIYYEIMSLIRIWEILLSFCFVYDTGRSHSSNVLLIGQFECI